MGAGRPIRVEFLVPMEGHSDDDRDASDVLDEELPDMYHQRTGGVHCCALRALRALLCTFLGPPMHGLRHKFSMSWNRIMQHSVRCMGA